MVSLATAASLAHVASLSTSLSGKILLTTIEATSQLAVRTFNQPVEHEEVSEVMTKLDITAKVKTVEAVIQAIVQNKSETNKVMDVCLQNLHEILDKITHTMKLLHDEIDYHNSKWFSRWRTLSVDGLVQNLKVEAVVLDKRFDTLIKLKDLNFFDGHDK